MLSSPPAAQALGRMEQLQAGGASSDGGPPINGGTAALANGGHSSRCFASKRRRNAVIGRLSGQGALPRLGKLLGHVGDCPPQHIWQCLNSSLAPCGLCSYAFLRRIPDCIRNPFTFLVPASSCCRC